MCQNFTGTEAINQYRQKIEARFRFRRTEKKKRIQFFFSHCLKLIQKKGKKWQIKH